MALPIDIGKVKKAAEKIQTDIDVEINLNVYVDTSANSFFIESISEMFKESINVNIDFIDLSKNKLHLKNEPNLAVIIAGEDRFSALVYKALNVNDIPALIVSITPQDLVDNANAIDINIPSKNVVCPSIHTYSKYSDEDIDVIDFDDYNIAMDANIKAKIASWFYDFAHSYRVAYASLFPFLRPKIADSIINTCAFQNAGIGAISLIPGADMPLMTLNQAKMILELAAVYGYSIDEDRIIEIVVVVLSAFAMKFLSNSLAKGSGLTKAMVKGACGFGGTKLLGNIAKNYFGSGSAIDGLAEKIKEKTGVFAGMFLPTEKL